MGKFRVQFEVTLNCHRIVDAADEDEAFNIVDGTGVEARDLDTAQDAGSADVLGIELVEAEET